MPNGIAKRCEEWVGVPNGIVKRCEKWIGMLLGWGRLGVEVFFRGKAFCAGAWFLLPVLLGFAAYGLILIDLSAVKIIRVARLLFRV